MPTGQGKEMAASGSQVRVIVRKGNLVAAGQGNEVNARHGKDENGRSNKRFGAGQGKRLDPGQGLKVTAGQGRKGNAKHGKGVIGRQDKELDAIQSKRLDAGQGLMVGARQGKEFKSTHCEVGNARHGKVMPSSHCEDVPDNEGDFEDESEVLREDTHQGSFSIFDNADERFDQIVDMREDIEMEEGVFEENVSEENLLDLNVTPYEETDEDDVVPPSPILRRDSNKPVVWYDSKSNDYKKTPPRRTILTKPRLEPIFELRGVNLESKLVQVINFSGTENKKEALRLRISDGETWIDVTLAEVLRIFLVGKMLRVNNLIKIIEYTGTVEDDNIVLVSFSID